MAGCWLFNMAAWFNSRAWRRNSEAWHARLEAGDRLAIDPYVRRSLVFQRRSKALLIATLLSTTVFVGTSLVTLL